MVVARREVLVQLDDDLVARLDELAERLEPTGPSCFAGAPPR
jgi:predicted transcriptional regulator